MLIRFYRKRGADAECYRAVQWPELETDQDIVIEEVRRLLGKHRPGAALIGRDLDNPRVGVVVQVFSGHTWEDFVGRMIRTSLIVGWWIVVPQDVSKHIGVVGNAAFHDQYEDTTLKGAS